MGQLGPSNSILIHLSHHHRFLLLLISFSGTQGILIPLLSTFQNFAIRLMSGVASLGGESQPGPWSWSSDLTANLYACILV
jgi:hypothetical protein